MYVHPWESARIGEKEIPARVPLPGRLPGVEFWRVMCLLGGPAILGPWGSTWWVVAWLVWSKGNQLLQTVGENFLSKVELGVKEEQRQEEEEEEHRVELEIGMEE